MNRREAGSKESSALIIGASRGLGLALAKEFRARNWNVVGTVRGERTALHAEAERAAKGGPHSAHLEVESLDMNDADSIDALRDRLASRRFDLLFVNAGVANAPDETVADVSTEEFTRVMVTNALSPMRVVEALKDLVTANGTIGVMSSGQGSVADNERGGFEIYRASKAALNTLMRSFAARTRGEGRTLLLIAPGWIRTEMGGPQAKFTIEEAIPLVVDTIIGQARRGGLHYLDRFGNPVRW